MATTRNRLRALALSILSLTSALAGSSAAMAAGALDCAQMADVAVLASSIALPTGGVRITAVKPFAATGTGAKAVGGFCRVNAEIAPVDLAAPPIKMEVNLPEDWNGKALMYGGGGFNGSILSTGGTIRLQPADVQIPLARGYATFGGNSGHEGSSAPGSFAVNEEALRNYALDAVKKTLDAARVLIAARYGRPAEKVYFHGSSNGGKEAFGMIQRYPTDIDGAIVFWPATMAGSLHLEFARIARAFAEPGAWPNVAKRKALLDAALAVCDGLDGIVDGVISNARACQARFDPATAMLDGKPLRCPDGTNTGDRCLSDPQIRALKAMASPAVLEYALSSGERGHAGFNVWGSDLGSKISDDFSLGVTAQGLGTVEPAFPTKANMPWIHIFADQFIKYFVTKDPSATWTNIDPQRPGEWQARIAAVAGMLDFPQADLTTFRNHGGKILLLHGMSDQIVPTQATEVYFERVVKTMGREAVAGFLKFYELPGTSHSGNGIAFTPTWDALGALDAWVSKGTAPADPVITDIYAVPGRTRPLCEYPSWPKYKGTGDVNHAASFTCVIE